MTKRDELIALADEFDEIEVDANGKCDWTAVASAQTHLRAQLRRLSALEAPAASDGEPVANKRPVAFRVRQYQGSDQFDVLADEADALTRADARGIDYEGLYLVADRYTAPPADAGMREAFVRVLASLAAAISILERTPKAKKAVASDKMFDTILDDYRKALEAGRTALTAPGATTKSDGDGCEMCFGTGRHEGRFSINGPLCSYCGGSGKKSDVEALAATTAERPGTVTSEPEPSTSDPFADKVPCHCHDAVSQRLCLDKDRCYTVEAQSRPSGPSSARSEVTVESLAEALCKACGKYWWQSEIHSAENARWIKAARALKAKYHMEGRE